MVDYSTPHGDLDPERRAFRAYMEARRACEAALRALVAAQEAWDREARRARRGTPCDHQVRQVLERATTQAALADARPAWDALRATGWVTQPAPGADRCAEREEGR